MRDISKGISLFNESDFFSAHDFFEDCWIECDREERLFFQGLVQISVGCYHLLNQNYKGCLSQFKKGTTKLKNFRPTHRNINLEKLVNEIESLIKIVNMNSSQEDPNRFLAIIPKLEINS